MFAVLLVEGLLGVLMPVVLKATVYASWLLSLINCFAAAVFFSFGALLLRLMNQILLNSRTSISKLLYNWSAWMTGMIVLPRNVSAHLKALYNRKVSIHGSNFL